ncbi:MAG: hypothetical protein GXZ08_02470 [Tissierellia bacterium]|nr:hypothetical protein [Tissierellia bacterium]
MVKCILNNSKDISQITGKFSISGSTKEVAEKLDIRVVRPDVDHYLPSIEISIGDSIELVTDEGRSIFKGIVWFRELDDNSMEQRLTCYDSLIYLNKSKPPTDKQVFTNLSADGIANELIKHVGLYPGSIAGTPSLTFNGRDKTYHEIIMGAYYDIHKKDGKKYFMHMKDGKVHISEQGQMVNIPLRYDNEAKPGVLLEVSFEESAESMINEIQVIDERNKDKVEKITSDLSGALGLISKTIVGTKGEGQGLIKPPKVEVDVKCIGSWDLNSGYRVYLESNFLKGHYYISEHNHEYSDGIHITKMKLTSENIMKSMDKEEVKK